MDRKEVAIIGLGPSGVSAAIYLKRYGMTPICYEKELIGGKVNKTEKIENYAGIPSISGPDLGMKLEEQLGKFSIKPIYKDVKEVKKNEDGTVTVKFKASGEYEILWHLFKWGESVKIISPKSLKTKYIEMLERTLNNQKVK